MSFLIVLIVAYAVIWPSTRTGLDARSRARIALAAGMVVAGVMHFLTPVPFIQHLPDVVPARDLVVLASGVVEIVLGLALLGPSRFRPLVGAALAAYLVAVFPGNLYVAVAGIEVEGLPGGIFPWIRLPLQAVFIGIAIWSTNALDAIPSRFRATLAIAQ